MPIKCRRKLDFTLKSFDPQAEDLKLGRSVGGLAR